MIYGPTPLTFRRFCAEDKCLRDCDCETCERCVDHCRRGPGCVFKNTGDADPTPWPTCFGCNRELSATLDAYYGHDNYRGRFCAPCRDKRLKKI